MSSEETDFLKMGNGCKRKKNSLDRKEDPESGEVSVDQRFRIQ